MRFLVKQNASQKIGCCCET